MLPAQLQAHNKIKGNHMICSSLTKSVIGGYEFRKRRWLGRRFQWGMTKLRLSFTTVLLQHHAPSNIVKFSTKMELCGRNQRCIRYIGYGTKQNLGCEYFSPDSTVFASILQECVRMKALAEGKRVHAQIVETGFETHIFVRNHLVIMYAKCGSIDDARKVFDRTPERNFVSWTAMITGYAQNGRGDEALTLFWQMLRTGIKVNQFTFSSVLRACAGVEFLEQGKQVHSLTVKTGFDLDVFVGSTLVGMYAKCGRVDDAYDVFDKMPRRDQVSWSGMIAGYTQNGKYMEALKFFWQMQLEGMELDQFSFCSVLGACASLEAVERGMQLHGCVIKTRLESDVFVGNALVDMYAKCGCINSACQMFDKMPKQNVISWSAMIAGYVLKGYDEKALKLFVEVRKKGIEPNEFTFSSVLKACASQAALEQGKQVHSHIIKTGFESDVFVGSVLVDMYGKCGTIEGARQMFDKMLERNEVSWNAMIGVCAQHGCGKEALQLFDQMQLTGVKPTDITFVSILSACSHAGLVDDGFLYFSSMTQNHGITPRAEHYACMVDLLGRAGRLDEAENFINKMPFEPNAFVWGALLGACRIRGNMELGQRAAEYLIELEPENTGTHVLLSNIYAAAGRWEDVAKVRKMMRNSQVRKVSGCSWIDVKNTTHIFGVEDMSHPRTEEIYAMLESLSRRMKDAGYMPDTTSVLHDVEEEQKEHILCHHSEKLAVAFGLISIPPGMPIIIKKNIRVCGDCHSAIKFISKIVGREFIVRDTSRFHHVKEGLCSCGDYW